MVRLTKRQLAARVMVSKRMKTLAVENASKSDDDHDVLAHEAQVEPQECQRGPTRRLQLPTPKREPKPLPVHGGLHPGGSRSNIFAVRKPNRETASKPGQKSITSFFTAKAVLSVTQSQSQIV